MICIYINPTRQNLLILSFVFSFFVSVCFVKSFITNFNKKDFSYYNEINIQFQNDVYSDNVESDKINTTKKEKSIPVLNQSNLKKDENLNSTNILKNNEEETIYYEQEEMPKLSNWKLVINKINLNAEVSEGTSQELLNQYIGHFENTSVMQGTVALCAHNRGYKVNYFERLNELEIGDEVQYITEFGAKNYNVIEHKIIKNDDWSDFIQEANKNKLILITCVENEPDLRRMVICLEKQ